MRSYPLIATLLVALAFDIRSEILNNGICGATWVPEPSTLERNARTDTWQRISRNTPQVGEKEMLWIYNYESSIAEEVNFTYRSVNAHSAILVADDWWSTSIGSNGVGQEEVDRLTKVFEYNAGPPPGIGKGIYQQLTEAFAPVTPVCDQNICDDGMVYIALCEIKSNLSEGYIVGFVSQRDRYVGILQSNERNLIIIDVRYTPLARAEQTLAHEFQHIIHNGIDSDEST